MKKNQTERRQFEEKIPAGLTQEIQSGNTTEAETLYIKNQVDISDDIVKVVFETVMESNNVAQLFVKPDADDAYENLKSLKELYYATGAVYSQPRSIRNTSVSRELDVVNPSVQIRPAEGYHRIPAPHQYESTDIVSELLGGIPFQAAILVPGLLYPVIFDMPNDFQSSVVTSIWFTTLVLIVMLIVLQVVGLTANIFVRAIRGSRIHDIPDSWTRIQKTEPLSEGDTIALGFRDGRSTGDICRVMKAGEEIRVRIRDGEIVTLERDTLLSKWKLYDTSTETKCEYRRYENLYVINF